MPNEIMKIFIWPSSQNMNRALRMKVPTMLAIRTAKLRVKFKDSPPQPDLQLCMHMRRIFVPPGSQSHMGR